MKITKAFVKKVVQEHVRGKKVAHKKTRAAKRRKNLKNEKALQMVGRVGTVDLLKEIKGGA